MQQVYFAFALEYQDFTILKAKKIFKNLPFDDIFTKTRKHENVATCDKFLLKSYIKYLTIKWRVVKGFKQIFRGTLVMFF